MQICAVYTNIKDGYENERKYIDDLFCIFSYLTSGQAVRRVIIDRNNGFDQLCEEAINEMADFCGNDVEIINSSKISTIDKMKQYKAFQRFSEYGNFVICDKSTKDFVREKISVSHFIEMPYSNLIIACSVPLY